MTEVKPHARLSDRPGVRDAYKAFATILAEMDSHGHCERLVKVVMRNHDVSFMESVEQKNKYKCG